MASFIQEKNGSADVLDAANVSNAEGTNTNANNDLAPSTLARAPSDLLLAKLYDKGFVDANGKVKESAPKLKAPPLEKHGSALGEELASSIKVIPANKALNATTVKPNELIQELCERIEKECEGVTVEAVHVVGGAVRKHLTKSWQVLSLSAWLNPADIRDLLAEPNEVVPDYDISIQVKVKNQLAYNSLRQLLISAANSAYQKVDQKTDDGLAPVEARVEAHGFHTLMSLPWSTHGNRMHLAKLGNGTTRNIELKVWNHLDLPCLFTINGLQLDWHAADATCGEVHTVSRSLEQSIVDTSCKLLRADHPKKIDRKGWFRYHSLLCRGYRCLQPELEEALWGTFSQWLRRGSAHKNTETELLLALVDCVESHYPGDTSFLLQLLLHTSLELHRKGEVDLALGLWDTNIWKRAGDEYFSARLRTGKTPSLGMLENLTCLLENAPKDVDPQLVETCRMLAKCPKLLPLVEDQLQLQSLLQLGVQQANVGPFKNVELTRHLGTLHWQTSWADGNSILLPVGRHLGNALLDHSDSLDLLDAVYSVCLPAAKLDPGCAELGIEPSTLATLLDQSRKKSPKLALALSLYLNRPECEQLEILRAIADTPGGGKVAAQCIEQFLERLNSSTNDLSLPCVTKVLVSKGRTPSDSDWIFDLAASGRREWLEKAFDLWKSRSKEKPSSSFAKATTRLVLSVLAENPPAALNIYKVAVKRNLFEKHPDLAYKLWLRLASLDVVNGEHSAALKIRSKDLCSRFYELREKGWIPEPLEKEAFLRLTSLAEALDPSSEEALQLWRYANEHNLLQSPLNDRWIEIALTQLETLTRSQSNSDLVDTLRVFVDQQALSEPQIDRRKGIRSLRLDQLAHAKEWVEIAQLLQSSDVNEPGLAGRWLAVIEGISRQEPSAALAYFASSVPCIEQAEKEVKVQYIRMMNGLLPKEIDKKSHDAVRYARWAAKQLTLGSPSGLDQTQCLDLALQFMTAIDSWPDTYRSQCIEKILLPLALQKGKKLEKNELRSIIDLLDSAECSIPEKLRCQVLQLLIDRNSFSDGIKLLNHWNADWVTAPETTQLVLELILRSWKNGRKRYTLARNELLTLCKTGYSLHRKETGLQIQEQLFGLAVASKDCNGMLACLEEMEKLGCDASKLRTHRISTLDSLVSAQGADRALALAQAWCLEDESDAWGIWEPKLLQILEKLPNRPKTDVKACISSLAPMIKTSQVPLKWTQLIEDLIAREITLAKHGDAAYRLLQAIDCIGLDVSTNVRLDVAKAGVATKDMGELLRDCSSRQLKSPQQTRLHAYWLQHLKRTCARPEIVRQQLETKESDLNTFLKLEPSLELRVQLYFSLLTVLALDGTNKISDLRTELSESIGVPLDLSDSASTRVAAAYYSGTENLLRKLVQAKKVLPIISLFQLVNGLVLGTHAPQHSSGASNCMNWWLKGLQQIEKDHHEYYKRLEPSLMQMLVLSLHGMQAEEIPYDLSSVLTILLRADMGSRLPNYGLVVLNGVIGEAVTVRHCRPLLEELCKKWMPSQIEELRDIASNLLLQVLAKHKHSNHSLEILCESSHACITEGMHQEKLERVETGLVYACTALQSGVKLNGTQLPQVLQDINHARVYLLVKKGQHDARFRKIHLEVQNALKTYLKQHASDSDAIERAHDELLDQLQSAAAKHPKQRLSILLHWTEQINTIAMFSASAKASLIQKTDEIIKFCIKSGVFAANSGSGTDVALLKGYLSEVVGLSGQTGLYRDAAELYAKHFSALFGKNPKILPTAEVSSGARLRTEVWEEICRVSRELKIKELDFFLFSQVTKLLDPVVVQPKSGHVIIDCRRAFFELYVKQCLVMEEDKERRHQSRGRALLLLNQLVAGMVYEGEESGFLKIYKIVSGKTCAAFPATPQLGAATCLDLFEELLRADKETPLANPTIARACDIFRKNAMHYAIHYPKRTIMVLDGLALRCAVSGDLPLQKETKALIEAGKQTNIYRISKKAEYAIKHPLVVACCESRISFSGDPAMRQQAVGELIDQMLKDYPQHPATIPCCVTILRNLLKAKQLGPVQPVWLQDVMHKLCTHVPKSSSELIGIETDRALESLREFMTALHQEDEGAWMRVQGGPLDALIAITADYLAAAYQPNWHQLAEHFAKEPEETKASCKQLYSDLFQTLENLIQSGLMDKYLPEVSKWVVRFSVMAKLVFKTTRDESLLQFFIEGLQKLSAKASERTEVDGEITESFDEDLTIESAKLLSLLGNIK